MMLFMDPIAVAGGGDMGGGGRGTWNGLEGSAPEGCRCPYMLAAGL